MDWWPGSVNWWPRSVDWWPWSVDTKFNALLEAAKASGTNVGSLNEVVQNIVLASTNETDHGLRRLSGAAAAKGATGIYSAAVAAKDAHVMATVLRGFMEIGLDGFVAGETASGLAAPAMFGIARAGSSAARGIFFTLSGLGVVLGCIDILAGLFQMFTGNDDAANALDGQADKLCVLARMMLVYGRGTAQDTKVSPKLPKMLVVSIKATSVRQPSYRFGDLTKRTAAYFFSGEIPTHQVYFTVTLPCRPYRQRKTEVIQLKERENAPKFIGHRAVAGDSSLTEKTNVSCQQPQAPSRKRTSVMISASEPLQWSFSRVRLEHLGCCYKVVADRSQSN